MIATLFLLFGCAESSQNPPPGSGDNTATDTGDPAAWTPPEGGVISLLTRDGVTLAADYYPAPSRERGGDPHPHAPARRLDARDWPPELVSAYTDAGLAVLAFDRRGAGDSEGDPDDAWLGECGRYDVEAAVLRVTTDGYVGAQLVGASNGTASMIDYAAWAGTRDCPCRRRSRTSRAARTPRPTRR